MSNSQLIDNQAKAIVQQHLDRLGQPTDIKMTNVEKQALLDEIASELKQRDAVLVAHYYTDPEIQALAEATGGCVSDSLEMARFGRDHPASTLMVAGVKFMGETA